MRASLLAAIVLGLSLACPALAATKDVGGGFRDHGVATPISNHRGTVATVDGQGRGVVLSLLMDHRGGYELLLIDVDAGKAEEYPMPFPAGDAPYAAILSKGNKFYTHFNSHFVEFDPAKRAFTFCRKTAPQMAMSMTEDDRGLIWSATYPQSGLVSFDPATRELKDYGHLYRQDWAQYPRAVAADDAGWVYLGVGSTACQIIAFNPATGKGTPVMPEGDRRHGSGSVFRATDGKVYGQPNSSETDNWLAFHRGVVTRIGKPPRAAAVPMIAGSQSLFHKVFPGGRRIAEFDLRERVFSAEDPKTKSRKTFHFDYTSEGAHVMGLAAAPGGTVCGGTAFPMCFFQYDPKSDQWVNREAYGQWNTVAPQGDRFFAGGYGHGYLLEWNPAAPWVSTVKGRPNCNPQWLVDCHPTINRPHDLLAHPDGRNVVLAGTPGYGYTGGGLLFWDRQTRKSVLRTHEELIPDQSTMSLAAWGQGKIVGGTTTAAGTGGLRKARQAELYLLDLATKRIEWHEAVFPGVQDFTDLVTGPDGLVWGFADRDRFFVFDPASRKVVHEQSTAKELGPCVSHQGPRAFVTGPAGEVYVLFVRAIARVEPNRWRLKLLAKPPVPIAAGGDWLDGRLYFAVGSHVWSYTP